MRTCRIALVLHLSLGCAMPDDTALGCSTVGVNVSQTWDAVGVLDRTHMVGAIEPLPTSIAVDSKKAALGERLFSDLRLSGDQEVACAHCHALDRGGANGEPHSSLRTRKKPVTVNVPTFFNVAFDFRYAWDGRFKTLEEQLDFAMASPNVMATSFADAAKRLRADEALVRTFLEAYPSDGLT